MNKFAFREAPTNPVENYKGLIEPVFIGINRGECVAKFNKKEFRGITIVLDAISLKMYISPRYLHNHASLQLYHRLDTEKTLCMVYDWRNSFSYKEFALPHGYDKYDKDRLIRAGAGKTHGDINNLVEACKQRVVELL